MTHAATSELEAKLDWLRESPKDGGKITCIVIRPRPNERVLLSTCEVSPRQGVHGDSWTQRYGSKAPDPMAQITIMNTRIIELLGQGRDQQTLSGDQFFADMDLSEANLPVGQRLRIGTAILEITPKPHTGCGKFSKRFGADALRFVNSREGRPLRLRGVYVQVVSAGSIEVGSTIEKIQQPHKNST